MARERFEQVRKTLITDILGKNGKAPQALRGVAFANARLPEPLKTLIAKVANDSGAIANADIHAVVESGTSEDQIFELVICAAVGEATREYEAALQALESLED